MKNQLHTIKNHWQSILFSLLILGFSLAMGNIVAPYTSWERNVDFLMTKQFIIHLDHYRLAFYIHIFSSVIVLVCGAFLFSKYILIRYKTLHKWIGKLYVVILLLLSAPSGMVMAFYANGGVWVKLSFILLTPLWWYVTVRAYTAIRAGKVNEHIQWMTRSYALTLSAVSLRVYQMVFSSMEIINPELQYLVISWGSWMGNLFFAEIYMYYKSVFKKSVNLNTIATHLS